MSAQVSEYVIFQVSGFLKFSWEHWAPDTDFQIAKIAIFGHFLTNFSEFGDSSATKRIKD